MPAEGLPQLSVEKKNTKKSFPHAGIRELLEFQSFSFINRHVQIAVYIFAKQAFSDDIWNSEVH